MNVLNKKEFLQKIFRKQPYTNLSKLNIETRNKVRAIFTSDESDSVKILNKLRRDLSVSKILDVEQAINAYSDSETILPEKFPSSFQIRENYIRLSPLKLEKNLSLLDSLAGEYNKKLISFIDKIHVLNESIVKLTLDNASKIAQEIIEKFGYSHLILRKIALINELLSTENKENEFISNTINDAVHNSNIIGASLVHCYQEEQDYLGIKRSIMYLQNQGDYNKFTRDIARIPFHPHASDLDDLNEIIQSNSQSSLIDAILIIKINRDLISLEKYKNIEKLINELEIKSLDIDLIIGTNPLGKYQQEDIEYLFLKQSSAWYEFDSIVHIRYLLDHFYDSPESDYINISPALLEKIGKNLLSESISDLLSSRPLLKNSGVDFKKAIEQGTVTRTAIFNYLVFTQKEEMLLVENELYELMGRTSALDKTIHVESIKILLHLLPTIETKLIFRLLIAKKSRSEADQVALKSLMEKLLKSKYESDLVTLTKELSTKSKALAVYLYETCNEDFIARMTRVIKTTRQITDTRANLHLWMAEYSGDARYSDRARNLIINSQINKIRGEIDDNRIYVDTNRFSEWFVDNIAPEMGSILLIIESLEDPQKVDNPQLRDLIEKCFSEFCLNSFFGIASYLGRRIRHGTFRGHLYSGVINSIEKKYNELLSNPQFEQKWSDCKLIYEKKVTQIIDERLYINTPQKKSGFLHPNVRDPSKSLIVNKCLSTIIEHFRLAGNVVGIESIVIESCWRIAEVDLKRFNSFIRGQKPSLTNNSVFPNINHLNLNQDGIRQVREFERDLQIQISEKLSTICSWFKKPHSASPKASLSLLYKAVVSEVQETFDGFNPPTDFQEKDDIELYGGVYHIFYDALYVIIFNAAKHGKQHGILQRKFNIQEHESKKMLHFKIDSEIIDGADEDEIRDRLKVSPDEDLNNAQVIENRSGIKKLYNLEIMDSNFNVNLIDCENRFVVIEFSYELGY